MNKMKFKQSAVKAFKSIWNSSLILLSIVMLIALLNLFLSKSFYSKLFTGFPLIDSFIGAVTGSILAGNPVTSYIIGGELFNQGVSLVAVVAFIVAWVTVGLVQFPAESILLGKKFATARNLISFVFSIIVALITLSIWMIL